MKRDICKWATSKRLPLKRKVWTEKESLNFLGGSLEGTWKGLMGGGMANWPLIWILCAYAIVWQWDSSLSLLLLFFLVMDWASWMLQTYGFPQCVVAYLEGCSTSMDFMLQGSRVHAALLCAWCLAQCWAHFFTSTDICQVNEYISLWNERWVTIPVSLSYCFCFPVMGLSSTSCCLEQPGAAWPPERQEGRCQLN